MTSWRRAWVWPVLGLLLLIVIWLVFIADGWSINRFILEVYTIAAQCGLVLPLWVWDTAANVAMLAPVAFLLGIGLPKVRWWIWGVMGMMFSAAIELIQGAFLPREASWNDWFANSSGAFLAAWLAELTNRWLARRAEKRSDLIQ